MDKTTRQFLELLKAGLWGTSTELSTGTTVDADLFRDGADWKKLYALAEQQAVVGICFDGIKQLPKNCVPDTDILMKWLGKTNYLETQYEEHKRVISDLAHFYDEQGVKMMVLKGYGLSKNYPVPNHRPTGDIDTYNFGQWQFADQRLHEKLGIEIDNSHHHHTVFTFEGVSVENHYDFLNVHGKKSNVEWEKVLKSLACNGMETKDEELENVYYPCPEFNALFIVIHSAGNFCAAGLMLRQVLDWLLFVRKHHDVIDWKFIYGIYKRFNLDRYVNSLNAIGIKYLGFDKSLFPELEEDENLVSRIMNDMLFPEYKGKEDGTLLGGIWVKSTRWWHNRWKYRITTPESLLSVLTYGIHSKLMKPAHIWEG